MERHISRTQLLRLELEYFFSSFDKKEIEDIIIAWLVITFSFAYINVGFSKNLGVWFLISAVGVGTGFIVHEMMHKFQAIKYDYPAHFVMFPLGLGITLFSALFLRVIFALPGATIFTPRRYDQFTRSFIEKYGRISLAGPLSNIFFGAIFFILFVVFSYNSFLVLLFLYSSYINFYLAAFNLLPIGFFGLDGYKVFVWSKKIWILSFLASVIPTVILFFII